MLGRKLARRQCERLCSKTALVVTPMQAGCAAANAEAYGLAQRTAGWRARLTSYCRRSSAADTRCKPKGRLYLGRYRRNDQLVVDVVDAVVYASHARPTSVEY